MAKFTLALTLGICLASASVLPAQEMTKPFGKWERKFDKKNHVTLTIEENRLHLILGGDKPITLHADYTMTRDGLIYGVITSFECEENEEADPAKTLFEATFCFRFRIDEGALIIHDTKAHKDDSMEDVWNGRYKAVRPASREAIVPTSYTVPYNYIPFPMSPPAKSSGSSSVTPTSGGQSFNYSWSIGTFPLPKKGLAPTGGGQTFNYWQGGFSR